MSVRCSRRFHLRCMCRDPVRPRHQRPAKLHPPREFNDVLGIDGFFWRGKRGFQMLRSTCV